MQAFRQPRLLLPQPAIELRRWAVIACDQYTSQPEYWQQVEAIVGDAPSTLRLIFPEAHLGQPDAPARIARIQQTMRRYLDDGRLREHHGAVYVERQIGSRVRRGLMLELDLEHYDFSAGSTSLIRPTEGTIVERLAPRIEVRRDAALELPHILVLIDDPAGTVLEPIGAERARLTPLYDGELMLGGGRVAGFAVDAARAERAAHALAALADPRAFAARYDVAAGTPPMLFAVGDGNHSLATAKAIWQQHKAQLGPDHPSRWALVEVENIHDAALDFAPIHRLLIGVSGDLRQALAEAFGTRLHWTEMPSAQAMRERVAAVPAPQQAVGWIGPGARFAVAELSEPPAALAVGSWQPVLDRFVAQGGAADIDYVHGDEALQQLAQRDGHVGLHFPLVAKSELLKRVVHGGPLPRKTFSMGEADEKRFYVEARRIR
ncbi:MAG TPA: DUF1015 domain-containing protein [Rubrivivax sp.]|nr:DUF1015 domain-containing protein [Rubrivivax sp.]